MAKAAAKKKIEKTDVEKAADKLVDEIKEEIEQMDGQETPEDDTETEEADTGDEASGIEHDFCKLFNLNECSPHHIKALKKAERLIEAGPVIALAASMLNMNLPE